MSFVANWPRSLYRRALKLSLDWTVLRHQWRGQALYIRSLFEAQRDVKDIKLQRVWFTGGLVVEIAHKSIESCCRNREITT
jgi:Complex 1 protein (LYR family)